MVPKNHNRSRLIGPPKEPLRSQALTTAGPRVIGTGRLRNSSSTLSALDQLPAWFQNAVPRKVLLPDGATRLTLGPPVSDSPRPPESRICISCAFETSYVSVDTPPPLNAAAVLRPSTITRPSFARPPWVVNIVICGVVCALKT